MRAVNYSFIAFLHSTCLKAEENEVGSLEESTIVEAVSAFGGGYEMKPSNICLGLKIWLRAFVIIGCTGIDGAAGQSIGGETGHDSGDMIRTVESGTERGRLAGSFSVWEACRIGGVGGTRVDWEGMTKAWKGREKVEEGGSCESCRKMLEKGKEFSSNMTLREI